MAKAYAPARASTCFSPLLPSTPTSPSCKPKRPQYTPSPTASADASLVSEMPSLQLSLPPNRLQSTTPVADNHDCLAAPQMTTSTDQAVDDIGEPASSAYLNSLLKLVQTTSAKAGASSLRIGSQKHTRRKHTSTLSTAPESSQDINASTSVSEAQDFGRLTQAFKDFGLVYSADMSDKLIAAVLEAKLRDEREQHRRLLESLARSRNSAFLKHVSQSESREDRHFLNPAITSIHKRKSYTPSHEKVNPVFPTRIFYSNSHNSVKEPITQTDEPITALGSDDSVLLNGVQYVKADLPNPVKSPITRSIQSSSLGSMLCSAQNLEDDVPCTPLKSPEEEEEVQSYIGDHVAFDEDNDRSDWQIPKGTVSKPLRWSETVDEERTHGILAHSTCYFAEVRLQVVVGSLTSGYFKFFVTLPIVEALLHHADFKDQLMNARSSNYLFFDDVQPTAFANLLVLLHHDVETYPSLLQHAKLLPWSLADLYCLVNKFHLIHIVDSILTALDRAKSFVDFLSSVLDVYKRGNADDQFRVFVRERMKETLSSPIYHSENSHSPTEYVWVKDILSRAFEIPDFGRDVNSVLVEMVYECNPAQTEDWPGPGQWQEGEDCETESQHSHASVGSGSEVDNTASLWPDKTDVEASNDSCEVNANVTSQQDKPVQSSACKRIHVQGLPADVNAVEVKDFFQKYYGEVNQVNLLAPQDVPTNDTLKDADVEFVCRRSAENAISVGTTLFDWGCTIHMRYAMSESLYDGFGVPYITFDNYKRHVNSIRPETNEGITAIAVKNSHDQHCSLNFRIGDRITCITGMAVPPQTHLDGVTPVPMFSGVCHGICGSFPMSYVRFKTAKKAVGEENDQDSGWSNDNLAQNNSDLWNWQPAYRSWD